MLPCIGDIDVMYYQSNQLAIPRGHPPPTQLPAEFHSYVKINEIIDSHLPGYVYIKLRYLLTYCPEDEKYNYVEYEEEAYLYVGVDRHSIRHGPASLKVYEDPSMLSVDVVPCTRCLLWPPQAADWQTRHRNHGWPDSATSGRVVNNGCDIARVTHRQCRQNEWMNNRQWRLSFSRAEIVLINSWMPLQQIVYHMLRVFMKTVQLTHSADNTGVKIVSNYHIKTLMLWSCELKPRSWWTGGLNLVKICVKLLHNLSVWLTDRRCQHYFINDCNLIDNTLCVEMVARKLMSIDETYLSLWFVENYIERCAQHCPNVNIGMTLQNTVAAVVDSRSLYSIDDCIAQRLAEVKISSRFHSTLRSFLCIKNELEKIDARLTVYFTAVSLLHVSCRITRCGFSDGLVDSLTMTLGHLVYIPRYYNQRISAYSLSQAANLMKVVANKSRDAVQLIEIELHRALRCKDSDSDSIYCLANVYLAVLYYITGHYQAAIDHCILVMRSQDHSQCSSRVVQGDILLKIDDNIDIMLGLTVFYQYVLSAALNQLHTQYVSVFTTELLAYYLNFTFLLVMKYPIVTQTTQTSSCDTDILQRYVKCVSAMHNPFISDIILYKLLTSAWKSTTCCRMGVVECGGIDRFVTTETEMNTSQLATLLQKSAVEHLTTYRQFIARKFASVGTIVTTDFEALYAYKHGDYRRCLQLSTKNLHTLLYSALLYDVTVCEEFIPLFDDNIVSLTALTRIVNPKCRKYVAYASVTQLTLSLYLMTQCRLKLRHSLMSLAETLSYIEVAQGRHPVDNRLDQLTLKLAECKILTYMSMTVNN